MPLKPLEGIPEHSILRVVVEAIEPPSTEEQLAMLREVPVAEELADAIEAGRNRINRKSILTARVRESRRGVVI
jgi:hypothetical protein